MMLAAPGATALTPDRPYRIGTIIVRANNRSDCAHGCRYCPIRRKQSAVALPRYEAFVRRLQDWMARHALDVALYHALGYHDNYDRADLDALRRLNGQNALPGITLGGLPQRTDAELTAWLSMLGEYGLRTVHATFGGEGDVHDRWNNKPGNYDLLMRTLRVAGAQGLSLGQRLLVARSTLSTLPALLDRLRELPVQPGDWRYAMPFFYQSAQQKAQPHVEEDRIDEAVRERLPSGIAGLFADPDETSNLSEREWMRLLRDAPPPMEPVSLVIRLTAASIDALEARSIDDIVGELSERTERAYRALPSLHELMARHGDPRETRIYAIRRCVEMKWLDLYRREHPLLPLEQDLTHLWFGA